MRVCWASGKVGVKRQRHNLIGKPLQVSKARVSIGSQARQSTLNDSATVCVSLTSACNESWKGATDRTSTLTVRIVQRRVQLQGGLWMWVYGHCQVVQRCTPTIVQHGWGTDRGSACRVLRRLCSLVVRSLGLLSILPLFLCMPVIFCLP